MKKVLIHIVFLSVLMTGCSSGMLSPVEFRQWVEDENNGLIVKKIMGQFEFAAFYKPVEYLALAQARGRQPGEKEMKELSKPFLGMQYYTLKIDHPGQEELLAAGIRSEAEYYERIEYFMGPMQDDLLLVQGEDTLPCLLFHFERNYGLAPYVNFSLGFETGDSSLVSDRTLIYNDRALGCGPVKLTIAGTNIADVPQLKIQ